MAPPSLVLFDLDGVLVDYDRGARTRHLARVAGCSEAHAWTVLFESGLEQRFDAGSVTTEGYLDELGHAIDVDSWTAARAAGVRLAPETVALLGAVAGRLDVAILTNNGHLLVERLPLIAPGLFPLLQGRVLCSAAVGHRKPEPMAYAIALERLGHPPAATLFLDDMQANVDGARRAGLHAELVASPASLRDVLARHGLP